VAILPQIYAPNAFSPNGDGYNEEFLIKGVYLETFRLRIFTRWGYKIFESHDQNEGWDGRYQDKDSPEGVYVFVVDVIGLDGSPVFLKGTVTLIR
jgi:gliding motility-associated-like protein